jgi:UDPglucose 6-dehydrogenase
MKSDTRIGPKAYLGPGAAFAGGTLARDVVSITALAACHDLPLPLISSIRPSNERHKGWALARLKATLASLRGATVAVLGLTYKPDTDTLRRSHAVELCESLLAEGCVVKAFDPVAKNIPSSISDVSIATSPGAAIEGSDAAVICTEWADFKVLPWGELIPMMRQPLILDANGFTKHSIPRSTGVRYFSVGTAT